MVVDFAFEVVADKPRQAVLEPDLSIVASEVFAGELELIAAFSLVALEEPALVVVALAGLP